MNLEKLLTLISPLHQEELPAVSTEATFSSKRDTHQSLNNPTAKAITMGLFYETVTALFYGGLLGEHFSSVSDELDLLTKPDLVNHDTKQFFESKSVRSGQHCMLLDAQLEGYDQLEEHFPDYSTSFAIYRHSLHGIKSSWQGTTDELFQELSRRTAYLVLLPYSIIQKFQTVGQSGVSSPLVYRYSHPRSTYDTCTCIRSSTLTRLAIEPQTVIDDLNFDREQFVVNRYRSPVCQINNFSLQPFPIIEITDLVEHRRTLRIIENDLNLPF